MANSKKQAKGNGPKNGPKDGKGESKSIAWREEQKNLRTHKSRGRAAPKDDTTIPILSVDEFIAGSVIAGHRVFFPAQGNVDNTVGATFEVNNIGDKPVALTLVSATSKVMAQFVNINQDVFLTYSQITALQFTSPLPGKARDKQAAMREFIRASIGEEGIAAFAENRKTARLSTPTDNDIEAPKEPDYVGENQDRWDHVGTDIVKAFTAMDNQVPAEIRIGKAVAEGIQLGFFWNPGRQAIEIHIGHVGKTNKLHRSILPGTFLLCFNGKIPESIPASIQEGPLGKSVKAFLDYLLGLDRSIRDPIMIEMLVAYKRLTKPALKVVPAPAVKPATAPVVIPALAVVAAQLAPVVQTTTPVTTAPAVTPTFAAPASDTEQSKDPLATLIEAMINAGKSPEEIGRATNAYLTAETKPAATKQTFVRAPQFGKRA